MKCPSILPATIVAALWIVHAGALSAAEPADVAGRHVLFMIGEDEYETEQTLPVFAREHLDPLGFKTTFVHADAGEPNHFPGLEALEKADLLFLSVRRRTPRQEELALVRKFLAAGKPLVGIRTASHAFVLRSGEPPAGCADWPGFDTEILGGRYDGHYGNRDGTDVTTVLRAEQHEIMQGIRQKSFRSSGTLYRSFDLGPQTTALMRGFTTDKGQPIELPVAWTNVAGKSRVFYTSLGHKDDFAQETFNQMLVNAVHWCLKLPVPGRGVAGSGRGVDDSPESRNRYKEDLAANEEVAELIRGFKGKGEVGDDSLPTPPDQAVRLFRVTEPLEIELLAAEPLVAQPLFITFDQRGRMWVVQYLQYPFPAGLKVVKYDQYLRAVFDKVPAPPPQGMRGADKITVLEDVDGDGTYELAKDVITGLNIATSLAIGHGGIWVLNPPYLLFYADADGDDVPDGDPEVHLSGFGLEDTHSVANSLRFGPDGWLYGANGSTTTATINSAATRNVHFKGQCIWRYHPETKVFEIYAEGGGNTFSLEIDSVGRVFSGTNNGDTRGMHYVQGGYAKKNWGKHGPLTNPYAFGFFEHMRHEGYDERFAQAFAIYEGGNLPEKYDHWVIAANSLHNRVWASRMLPDTSTFRTVDDPPLVVTSDRWFRPVDVKVGPDGAVYLADWYDSRLTHVDPRDNWHKTSGRIYRLKTKGSRPLAPFDLARMSGDELIELFSHPNKWFRQEAVRVLGQRRDAAVMPKLAALALSDQHPGALEALWALNLSGGFNDAVAAQALRHGNPHVRRWAVRLLGDVRHASPALARQMVLLAQSEPDVEVRSQLASSAKRLPAQVGLPIVRQLLARDEDMEDLHLPLLCWWAIEGHAETDRQAVLALFEDPAFWSLPIVERYVLERIMQRYALAGGAEDLDACVRLLELAPGTAHSSRLMVGMQAAFQGRAMTGLPPALTEALVKYQESLGKSDLALALRLAQPKAIDEALRLVADPGADKAQRLTCIEILGQIRQPKCVPTLVRLLGTTGAPAINLAALQALLNYDDPTIGRDILRYYHSTLTDEHNVRSTAHRVLVSRKAWALALLEEIEKSHIRATSIPLDVVQQMLLHGDDQIERLVTKHWGKLRGGTPAEKQDQIRRVAGLLKSGPGNDAVGRELFKEHCGKCHTLFDEGGNAGPNLTGYERDNLNFLLPAVIDPSAAIREEYTNFAVITNDGRTLTGLIAERTPRTLTLRGVDGQPTIVDTDHIDTLQALSVSIMPDGLLDKLSEQQIRDLFAYVMSRTPAQRDRAAAQGARSSGGQ